MVQYAFVTNNTVDSYGALPTSARRLDTDEWVLGLANASTDLQHACGYYEVTTTPRPDDTADTTYDYSVELVDGTPTETWTQRAKTADEIAAQTSATNQGIIETAMDAALTQLQVYIDAPDLTFSNLAQGVTAVQTLQHAVQKMALFEKQIIRLLRGDFDETN